MDKPTSLESLMLEIWQPVKPQRHAQAQLGSSLLRTITAFHKEGSLDSAGFNWDTGSASVQRRESTLQSDGTNLGRLKGPFGGCFEKPKEEESDEKRSGNMGKGL